MIIFIVAYVIGGAIFAYQVNSVHKRRYDENITGEKLLRAIPLFLFWPLTILVMMFPPTARYIETGSFKR